MHLFSSLVRSGFLFVGLAAAGSALAQAPVSDKATFQATVTSFQTSVGGNGLRFVTAVVHFHNKTKKPLILACDLGKAKATDDQGNVYGGAMVRGIGKVSGNNVDAKFVLGPEGDSDILVEMRTRLDRTTIFGMTYDMDLGVREIIPLEGNQLRLGQEHALEFTGLKNGLAGEGPHMVNATRFTAEITRSKTGRSGRWLVVDFTMKIKNTSDKPLILAYETTSSYGIDDQGNRFGYGVAGTHDGSFSGIGGVTSSNADPQFTLEPGETKEVHFSVRRSPEREVAGTKLGYYVSLQELEILPSQQIREVRQYSLAFPEIKI